MERAPPVTQPELEAKALFEEYRALYSIAAFRMGALDRRLPITAGAITAVLSGMDVVSADSQIILFVAVPLALVWFVRATINHARSFEDVLRRIEQIERSINALVGKQVLRFQSCHPSRLRNVGGRTSRESVSAVMATSLILLGVTAFRMYRSGLFPRDLEDPYLAGLALIGMLMLDEGIQLSRYRYEPPPDIQRL
jgi:hypothetical protein